MLRKPVVYLLFSVCLCGRVSAQNAAVDNYTQQLFFNVFREKPDTAISSFLRYYVPSLYNKKQQPNSGSGGTNYQYEIHTFLFQKHPYFKMNFSVGKLEFHCQRFPDERGVQVYNVKLWFEFDTQMEAEMAYNKLIEMMLPVSTAKNFSSANGYMKAEFTDSRGQKGFNQIQFRLMADNLDKGKFKILFENENGLQ